MSLEKEFVPYEESLELKELGFDESCFAYWNDDKVFELNPDFLKGSQMDDTWLTAPTFSQAFRWFREKYNLKGGIEYIGGLTPDTTWWDIYIVGHFNTDASKMTMKYQPYEEAELACLRQLIKIVKDEIQTNQHK